jgi:hypothetical protein
MGWAALGVLPDVPGIGIFIRGLSSISLGSRLGLLGLGLAIALGAVAGFVPALGAYRARITDMLRQV